MNETPWWHEGEGASGGDDPLGTAAGEAARLFEVLRDRMMSDPATLRTGLRLMEAFTVLRGPGEPVAPGGAPECAYCPVCQAISRARHMDAETVERLTGAALEFAETVRRTVSPDSGADQDSGGVRHVPLDDDDDTDGDPQSAQSTPGDHAGAPDPVADVVIEEIVIDDIVIDDVVIDEGFLGWPGDDGPTGADRR